ncbi:MAG: RluA family pseudouridine synthase [Flavobacteriales bacterium]|nr:RluA family pseudouridine synthase [Flavobacteriales bacterium]
MVILKTHIVPEGVEDIRLYDYAQQIFPTIPSRKGIKKAIAREEIIVDGEKTSTGLWIKPGQKIELLESSINPPKEYHLKLEVVYEDEYFAVINKPAGIPVSGNQFRTIQNALIGNVKLSKEEDALRWPKPVHRLDSPTSGLLLIAKTAKALVKLGQQFENKEIQKKYCAIVIGEIPETGTIDFEIEGLKSLTEYQLNRFVPSLRNEFLSLVNLYPKTGRTHQLRIHLSKLGFSILGDKLYGNEGGILVGKGLFLAAIELQFNHPITKEPIIIEAEVPYKFNALLERENRRWEKYND